MRPDLRKEVLRILEGLANGNWEVALRPNERQPITFEAIALLQGSGAILGNRDRFIVTIIGYEYKQKIEAPVKFWFKKNWFPVAVILVTSVVTVSSSLIVNLLD